MAPQRFEMLVGVYGDEPTSEILSEETLIRSWLRVEAALATAMEDRTNWERATRITPGLLQIHSRLAQAYERATEWHKKKPPLTTNVQGPTQKCPV